MANFSFTVDTEPMAGAVHSVIPHVGGTTAAVVSMQTAVIIAEKQATQDICKKLDQGFFSLIRSQVSQKIATCRSQVEARLLELRDLNQKLMAVKTAMERDFQMIASRYTKLFRSLDAALIKRVHEVNAELLDLVQKDIYRLQERKDALQASVPTHQMESIHASQEISASASRARASRVIGAMAQFIRESNSQDRLTSAILSDRAVTENSAVLLPFALQEYDSAQTLQKQWTYTLPSFPVPKVQQIARQSVEVEVLPALGRVEWAKCEPQTRDAIVRNVSKLIEQNHVSDRVRNHIVRMLDASPLDSISGVRS